MIVIEPPSSPSGNAEAFAALRKPELARFLLRARRAAGVSSEITILICDDARIKALNRDFRGKNKATDVLSFPAGRNDEGLVGDLAVSLDTAARQAADHGHTVQDELRVLLLHGVLHLAGHDHEADTGEMRQLETELREKLKLPAGLIERAQPPAKRTPASRKAAKVRKP